ncbi:MAG: hypothetical protein HY683_03885 [Chloroflexi bacterium]|nr:hypothetical protein [Chloroflexota bacterium]
MWLAVRLSGALLAVALLASILTESPQPSQGVFAVARDRFWASNSAAAPNTSNANLVKITVTQSDYAAGGKADTGPGQRFDVVVTNLATGEKAYGNVDANGAAIAAGGKATNASGVIRVREGSGGGQNDGKFIFTVTVRSDIPADEDANNNGALDPGEDLNGNSVLDLTRVGTKIGDGGTQRQVGWIRGFQGNVIQVAAGPLSTAFAVDSAPPVISSLLPSDAFETNSDTVVISGQVTDIDSRFPARANLTANDLSITVVGVATFGPRDMIINETDNGLTFALALILPAGNHEWYITAKDVAGNVSISDADPGTIPVFRAIVGQTINPNK